MVASQNFIKMIILFILATIGLLTIFHKDQKQLKLWNIEKKYKEAANIFLNNCKKGDTLSCQLTQLAKVQDYYTEVQNDELKLFLIMKKEKDPVIVTNDIITRFSEISNFSEMLEAVSKINDIDFKFLQSHKLYLLNVVVLLNDMQDFYILETAEYKRFRLKVANELIKRNAVRGFELKGRSMRREKNFIEATKSYNECALRGIGECIHYTVLSYATGIGRLANLNEATAWYNICVMIGYHEKCDRKLYSILNDLKNKNNFNYDESERLSQYYKEIVTKNLSRDKQSMEDTILVCNDFICDQV